MTLGKANDVLNILPAIPVFLGVNRSTDGRYRINFSHLGWNTGTGLLGIGNYFSDLIRITNNAALVQFKMRDVAVSISAGGLWSILLNSTSFEFWTNTAAGGDFSSKFIPFIVKTSNRAALNGKSATDPAFSGDAVLFMRNAAVVPATNPTSGFISYVESNDWKARNPSGTVTTITTAGGNKKTAIQTVQSTTTTAIDTASDTILLTAPSLATSAKPVIIVSTITFDKTTTGDSFVTVKLFRDGTELSTTDRFIHRVESTDDNISMTFIWADTTATGSHVYSVRAIAGAATINRVGNSRLTVYV